MATRKTNIDIEYDEPQQEATLGAAEPNSPYESQDPADWVPPMTVRIYPISKPRTKLLATGPFECGRHPGQSSRLGK